VSGLLAVGNIFTILLAPSHKGPCLATRQVFRDPPPLPSSFFNWLPLHLRYFLSIDAVSYSFVLYVFLQHVVFAACFLST
jgi:hypothetical protein